MLPKGSASQAADHAALVGGSSAIQRSWRGQQPFEVLDPGGQSLLLA